MSALPLPPLPPLAAGARLWVGYSGGGDSAVLLHQLRTRAFPGLRAVHVHHGLQPDADAWVRHCRGFCRELGVPLRVLRIAVVDKGQGPEAAARAARYAAIGKLLRPGDVLATAHHRDDQAETVLMRALRGSGVAGLGAMRVRETLGAATLWRPLLALPRRRLHDYAVTAGLRWIEDAHNADPRYARAALRTEILPRLNTHFPAAAANLAQLALQAQAADRLLAALAQDDHAELCIGGGIDIAALLALTPERRHNLLYHAWRRLGLMSPEARWFAHLDREVLRARADATPLLVHGDGEARRYRGWLYLMRRLPPAPALAPDQALSWGRRRQLRLPDGCGVLRANRLPPTGTQVRFASGGECLRLPGGAQQRTLKNLCQEFGVPVWVRERMPLVFLDGELLSAGGWWHAQRSVDLGLRFDWTHTLAGAPELSEGGRIT